MARGCQEPMIAFLLASFLLAVLTVHGAPQYPSFDGSGHNEAYPGVGLAGTPYSRIAISTVADFGPTLQGTPGAPLPSPRTISLALAPTPYNKQRNVYRSSEILTYLGQYISQELSRRENDPSEPAPIPVQLPDPFFSDYTTPGNATAPVLDAVNSQRSLRFLRSKAVTDSYGVRQPINTFTGFVDGSVVYGNSEAVARKLRSGSGGLLRDGGVRGLPLNQEPDDDQKELLAMANEAQRVPNTRLRACGDSIINQNPGLLAMGTVFLREHNRRAQVLALENPEWGDEEVFQRARAWVIGHLQAIAYNEYFPKLGLVLPPYKNYTKTVNPGIDNFFATVAYRYGHAAVTDVLLRLDDNWDEHPKGHLPLINGYFNPDESLSAGVEALLRGLMTKAQGEVEARFSESVQQNLFGQYHSNGTDLVAINIQRGRDHGIPDYNTCRRQLGLAPKTSFSDITSDASVAAALSRANGGNIGIVDAYVGGLAEQHVKKSHVGELFYASMVEQLTRLRDGDYWFYLNPSNGMFNETEQQEIFNTGLANLIARNTNITGMPRDIYTVEKDGGAQCAVQTAGTAAANTNVSNIVSVADGQITVTFAPGADDNWLRVTVTALGQGFVGFGVPLPGAQPGNMMPGADVVIGRVVDGVPTVDDYSIPSDTHTLPVLDTATNGANNVNLISFDRSNGQTVMVFERPYAANDATDLAINKTGPVTFIMSFGDTDTLGYHGGLQRDFMTLPNGIFGGGAITGKLGTFNRKNHGILMAINFIVVLPIGALLARQLRARWITSRPAKATLFYIHIATQLTGVAIATAGFVIAVRTFDEPIEKVPFSHGRFGVGILALLYSQVLMGFVRPPSSSRVSPRTRRWWDVGHMVLGRSAMMLGTINVFLGCYIFCSEYGANLMLWCGLCAAGVAFIALLQHVLDRRERHAVDLMLMKQGLVVGAGGTTGKMLTEKSLRDLDQNLNHSQQSKDPAHVPHEGEQAYYAEGSDMDGNGAGWHEPNTAAVSAPGGSAAGVHKQWTQLSDDRRPPSADNGDGFQGGVAGPDNGAGYSDGPRIVRLAPRGPAGMDLV